MSLILFAFINGNSSLEHLLEGLLSQIYVDLSPRFPAGIGADNQFSFQCRALTN